ncbi:MAG: class II aldolase/adducin family protein [Candidatus Eisenbacteria bacterium]
MAYRNRSQRHALPSPEQIDLFLEIGRRLDAKGWVAANDGNLSVREADGTFLVTASGAPKGYLRRNQILRVDADGKLLAGEGRPSSELDLHLTIYRERPDVSAVVHAHPPVSTAYAVAREPLDACVLPELVLTLGRIPIAPYATPGTPDLGASVVDPIRTHDAVLLANHGAVTAGKDLESAYFTMERVEHGARILLYAHLLGRVTPLGTGDVERLLATGSPGTARRIPCVPGDAMAPNDVAQVIREVLAERGKGGPGQT